MEMHPSACRCDLVKVPEILLRSIIEIVMGKITENILKVKAPEGMEPS